MYFALSMVPRTMIPIPTSVERLMQLQSINMAPIKFNDLFDKNGMSGKNLQVDFRFVLFIEISFM